MPFSVTHAGCRAVHDHPRNLADWQLEGLAERGGVLGMMALPFIIGFLTPELRWLDHFDRAVGVMGIGHVGLGADFVDQATPTNHELGLDEVPQSEAARVGPSRASHSTASQGLRTSHRWSRRSERPW